MKWGDSASSVRKAVHCAQRQLLALRRVYVWLWCLSEKRHSARHDISKHQSPPCSDLSPALFSSLSFPTEGIVNTGALAKERVSTRQVEATEYDFSPTTLDFLPFLDLQNVGNVSDLTGLWRGLSKMDVRETAFIPLGGGHP